MILKESKSLKVKYMTLKTEIMLNLKIITLQFKVMMLRLKIVFKVEIMTLKVKIIMLKPDIKSKNYDKISKFCSHSHDYK